MCVWCACVRAGGREATSFREGDCAERYSVRWLLYCRSYPPHTIAGRTGRAGRNGTNVVIYSKADCGMLDNLAHELDITFTYSAPPGELQQPCSPACGPHPPASMCDAAADGGYDTPRG
jgi:hypothetical protein